MERRLVVASAWFGVGLLLVCGCKRKAEPEQAGTLSVTSSTLQHSLDDASERLGAARCEAEFACSNLTSWTRPENKAECAVRRKAEMAKELSPEACAGGINHEKLVECIAAIERMGCDNPVGRLMELEDCKTSRLCPRQ